MEWQTELGRAASVGDGPAQLLVGEVQDLGACFMLQDFVFIYLFENLIVGLREKDGDEDLPKVSEHCRTGKFLRIRILRRWAASRDWLAVSIDKRRSSFKPAECLS